MAATCGGESMGDISNSSFCGMDDALGSFLKQGYDCPDTGSIRDMKRSDSGFDEFPEQRMKRHCRDQFFSDSGRRDRPSSIDDYSDRNTGCDALMELAKENLILHRNLYLANLEVARLKGIISEYEETHGPPSSVESKPSPRQVNQQAQSQSRYWTAEEHKRFLDAIQTFKHKDVKAIAQYVGTRNSTQVRTHAQKYFMKLARQRRQSGEQSQSGPQPDEGSVVGDDCLDSISSDAGASTTGGGGGT